MGEESVSPNAGDVIGGDQDEHRNVTTSAQQPPGHEAASPDSTSISVAHVALGASAVVVETATSTARRAGRVLGPLARVALRPPGVPQQLQPARIIGGVAREGASRRASIQSELSRRLDVLVPALLAEVLRRARLTDLVLRYVDLDDIVDAVDLDRAAARLDVDGVVRRVDLDSAASRIDVEAVVRRVDIDAVARRLDLDAVIDRLDFDVVLDRLDLTSVVLQRVDLDALVKAILGHMDLVALAEEIIDGVDLPEIIRESTGTMASDTVRGARMQGVAADDAVGRAVDRLLLRRGRRSVDALGDQRAGQAENPTVPAQSDGTY